MELARNLEVLVVVIQFHPHTKELAMAWKLALRGLLFLAGGALLLSHSGLAQNKQSEYAVKGAFLYNFAKYVEWPSHARSADKAAVDIGVFGSDACARQIEDAIGQKQVDGRKVVVRRISTESAAEGVSILFIPRTSMGRMSDLAGLRTKPILIVGEVDGFASRYGHIGFVLDGGRLGFEIADKSSRIAGLTISSKLLQLAKKVY